MTVYGPNIDCRNPKVILKNEKGPEVCLFEERLRKEHSTILIMKASKLLRQWCIGYLCYATEVKEEEVKIENISVVCEFPNVFPKELSGLPP